MIYNEITAVRTNGLTAFCVQNIELCNATPGHKYVRHCAVTV